MSKEPDYYTVIEEEDGTLTCNCTGSRETNKTCEHTFGVKMEIDFGNVERYNELETIRKIRGKAAKGQKNNPVKEKKSARQYKRRSDRTVTADRDRFFDQVKNKVNQWQSDEDSHDGKSDTSVESDDNANGLGIDDPLERKGSQLTKGRPPATSALHAGRTAAKGKGKAKKADTQSDDTPAAGHSGAVRFSNPPGPKRGHVNSVLTGSSPAKKEFDEREKKRQADERAKRDEERREKKAKQQRLKKEAKEAKAERRRQKHLSDREPEDQANELQMFDGVDELERWNDGAYQMREDEGLRFTDIATALSACLGSGFLVLPSYFRQLAKALGTFDWDTKAKTIADGARTDGPFSEGSLFQHLRYYAKLIDPVAVLFLHRDEDKNGREHWLLFRQSRMTLECFEPLENHQKIRDMRNVVFDMRVVYAFFCGEDYPSPKNVDRYETRCLDIQRDGASCGFWSTAVCLLHVSGIDVTTDSNIRLLKRLKISGVKQHLSEIWTSWQIGEEGLEEEALNHLLNYFGVRRKGPFHSCIASRPSWIGRAEDQVPKPKVPAALPVDPAAKTRREKKQGSDAKQVASNDDVTSEQEILAEMKDLADIFCAQLAADRNKLVGGAAPIFLDHLHRISSLTGWFNCDVINVWAGHLGKESPTHTEVRQHGFFNQLREIQRWPEKTEYNWQRALRGTRKWFKEHETRAIILPIHVPSHWICAFVDFDRHYLAIFDSWKEKPVPDNDWKKSKHVKIFELIKEWLQRLFLALGSAIDWDEWFIDPCPKQQFTTDGTRILRSHTSLASSSSVAPKRA
ncbi:hypothetical protein C8R44DRAFT_850941 [Mycena epipterygia]|nr:hypothetical protein C8R44DRAFT_850941 [Mycena epipterygia]